MLCYVTPETEMWRKRCRQHRVALNVYKQPATD